MDEVTIRQFHFAQWRTTLNSEDVIASEYFAHEAVPPMADELAEPLRVASRGDVNERDAGSRLARHVSPLTTTVYTHPSDDEMSACLRTLAC